MYLSWQMARCDPDAMLWQEQALKTQVSHRSLTPILARTGHQYRTTWVEGVPISHTSEVQVYVQHNLGVEGCLAGYELVGPTWQLNVINVHVPFGDATETFLEHLMEAYRQLAMGWTLIIGDLNAAPSVDDRRGPLTSEDKAVQMAMHTWAYRTSQPPYETSPQTNHRNQAQQIPASTFATRTRHTLR